MADLDSLLFNAGDLSTSIHRQPFMIGYKAMCPIGTLGSSVLEAFTEKLRDIMGLNARVGDEDVDGFLTFNESSSRL